MRETLQKLKSRSKEPVAVIGFPFDAGSSFLRGPADAPPLIRAAHRSPSANTWSELGIDVDAPGNYLDLGDLDLPDDTDALALISENIDHILDVEMVPLSLGGDHAITASIVKAMATKYADLHILHFDAHPDLYDALDGNPLSHACPFARIMESGRASRLVQIGIRTMTGHQREQAIRFGVEVHEMKDGLDRLPLSFDSPLYISFDMDVLDPAFAPGVSHHEPGGLSTRQAIDLIHGIKGHIVGADLVELNPRRDPLGITAMAAGKIFKELLARIVIGVK